MDQTLLAIVRLIVVVLVSGGGDKEAMQTRISADLYPAQAPIYAQANVGAVRAMVAADKDAMKVLYGDRKPAEVTAQALEGLAKSIRMDKAKLAQISANLRSVGAWYLAMGEDEHQQRVLVALDFKKKVDIVSLVNAMSRGQGDHVEKKLGNWKLHQFIFGRRGPQLWLAERDGLVFAALEPLAVKRAVRANAKMPVAKALDQKAPLMIAKAHGEAVINQITPLLSRHDKGEFYVISEMFDFSAYKTLNAELTSTGLKAVLEVEADSVPAQVLKPRAKGSRVLKMLPKKGVIGAVAAIEDPKAVMSHIEDAMKPLARRMGGNPMNEVRQVWTRELGVDFDKDFIANIAGAGVVVIDPKQERDLERKAVFLFEVIDEAKARKTFEAVVAAAGQKMRDVGVETLRDKGKMVTFGRDARVKMGIHKGIVAFSAGRNLSSEEVTKLMISAAKKEENKTGLLAAGVLDLGELIPFKIKPVQATLSRQKNTFVLQSNIEVKSFLPLLGKPGKPGEIMPFMAKAIVTENLGDLKQIALGCLMYSGENNGTFPPNFKKLMTENILNAGKVYTWKNPATGEEKEQYIYCPGLRDDNARSTSTILAAAPKPYNGKRVAVFVDGHAEHLTENRFQALAKRQGWKPGIGVAVKEIPKVKREEIRALCKRLSSDKFKERTAAKKKLKELGPQAWPILKEFEKHKDPEVRMVVKELLQGK